MIDPIKLITIHYCTVAFSILKYSGLGLCGIEICYQIKNLNFENCSASALSDVIIDNILYTTGIIQCYMTNVKKTP